MAIETMIDGQEALEMSLETIDTHLDQKIQRQD